MKKEYAFTCINILISFVLLLFLIFPPLLRLLLLPFLLLLLLLVHATYNDPKWLGWAPGLHALVAQW